MRVMIHEYTVKTQDSGPYGITRGKDAAMWFTEQRGNRIGRINEAGEITSFNLPTENGLRK